jgi:hypothetical protein
MHRRPISSVLAPHRPLGVGLNAALALALALAACSVSIPGVSPAGYRGPISSEAEAIAALRALPYISEPMRIHAVEFGRADHVYDGVYGSSPSEEHASEQQRKRERPAWAVDFTAVFTGGCDTDPCEALLWDSQVVFDAGTGEILFSVSSEHRDGPQEFERAG